MIKRRFTIMCLPPYCLMLVVLMMGLHGAGLHAGDTKHVPDQAFLVKYLGQDTIGRAIEAPVITTPSDYYPFHKATYQYKTLMDDQRILEKDVLSSQDAEMVQWLRTLGERAVDYLVISDRGSVIRPRSKDRKQNVVTTFTPGEVVVPMGMSPGEQKSNRIRVEVRKIDKPAKVAYKGELTQTVTYVGAYEIHTPAGTFETIMLSIHYEGKVGPASIDDMICAFYAKGVGRVAEVKHHKVSAFMLYNEDTRIGRVLAAIEPSQ